MGAFILLHIHSSNSLNAMATSLYTLYHKMMFCSYIYTHTPILIVWMGMCGVGVGSSAVDVVHVFMWRPEDNVWCYSSGNITVLFVCFVFVFEIVFGTVWNWPSRLGLLASDPQELACVHSPVLGHKHVSPYSLFLGSCTYQTVSPAPTSMFMTSSVELFWDRVSAV